MNALDNMSPERALRRLIAGNKRFASGLRSIESIASSQRREQLARQGQKPFAIILTCSDSRVPAETVFDAGLGDLFVVRVAGNIAAPSLIASIEFAALSFGTPICVVMGHSQCGAIHGAVTGLMKKHSAMTPNLDILIKEIEPAAEKALKLQGSVVKSDDRVGSLNSIVDCAIEINVRHTISQFEKASSHLRDLQATGTFQIVGAVYDISEGCVKILDQTGALQHDLSAEDQKTTPRLA